MLKASDRERGKEPAQAIMLPDPSAGSSAALSAG
jgi:hypothetical protein